MSGQAETEIGASKGNRALEGALENLWMKARRASEVILGLREENRALQKRVAELEAELAQVEEGLGVRAEEITKLKEDFSLLKSHNNDNFTKEEKEELRNKILVLIEKISSHL